MRPEVETGSVSGTGSLGRGNAGPVAEASLVPAGGGVRQGSYLGGRPNTGSGIGSETDDSSDEDDEVEGDGGAKGDTAAGSGSGGAGPGGKYVRSLGHGNGSRGAQSSSARASLEEAQRQHMASLESDRVRAVAGGPLQQDESSGSDDGGDGDDDSGGSEEGEGRVSSSGGGGGSGTKRLSVR